MVSLCGVLCLAMWLPSTTPGVLVGFACTYGFASGVFISVTPAAAGQITPSAKLGARLGAFGTVTSVAVLTGTPIAGALVRGDTREGYQPLIIFAVGSFSLACARSSFFRMMSMCLLTSMTIQGCCLLAGGIIIFIARVLHDRSLRSRW